MGSSGSPENTGGASAPKAQCVRGRLPLVEIKRKRGLSLIYSLAASRRLRFTEVLVGKNKRLVWLLFAGAAIAAASAFVAPDSQQTPTAGTAPSEPKIETRTEGNRLSALPQRVAIGEPRGEPFASQSWAPPPPPPALKPEPVRHDPAPQPAKPAAPPVPYRVAGKLVHEGGSQVVLAKGDAVVTVRAGDELEDGYKVESIGSESVALLYLPLGTWHDLPFSSSLSAQAPAAPNVAAVEAGAAQLRWEGPKQVRAGNTFDVALKVTSPQPLRASPLQLSFDAELLQPVNVRAGSFYAGGTFSYRVNPAGSIFVGASGKGAVAADAEFLVLTFRPIRPGATAELKLSSVMLQGASGRPVGHAQPEAFRTNIVQ
jgi:hypothetical protein